MGSIRDSGDEDLRIEVVDALVHDARVDASGINVDVVDGTVYLTGTVPTPVQKGIVRDIVSRIKGVIDVDDEIETIAASTRSDFAIEEDVKAALQRDALVDVRRITVRVNNGIVYLTGTTSDLTGRTSAEDDARKVKGIVEVVNDIAVVPTPARLDGEIAEDVRRELERNIRIDPQQISVEVADGVVFLRGSVATDSQRWIAEDLARWIPGVVDVIDELKIEW